MSNARATKIDSKEKYWNHFRFKRTEVILLFEISIGQLSKLDF